MSGNSSKRTSHNRGKGRNRTRAANAKRGQDTHDKGAESRPKGENPEKRQSRRSGRRRAHADKAKAESGKQADSGVGNTTDKADKNKGNPTNSGSTRRRFFRKRKSSNAEGKEARESKRSVKRRSDGRSRRKDSTGDKEGRKRRINRSQQTRRRNRRTRSKDASTYSIVHEIEQEYVPPESVFVYTHLIKPNNSSGNEFRAESLPLPTRRIEDFQIDLSGILGTILEVDEEDPPKFQWDWGTPDEELDEQADSARQDTGDKESTESEMDSAENK